MIAAACQLCAPLALELLLELVLELTELVLLLALEALDPLPDVPPPESLVHKSSEKALKMHLAESDTPC